MNDIEAQEAIQALARGVGNQIYGVCLSSALFIGLVRRKILTPDDAREIINRAMQISDAYYAAEATQSDVQIAAVTEARKLFLVLLEHPEIKPAPAE